MFKLLRAFMFSLVVGMGGFMILAPNFSFAEDDFGDVFLNEGEGDFDTSPLPPDEATSALPSDSGATANTDPWASSPSTPAADNSKDQDSPLTSDGGVASTPEPEIINPVVDESPNEVAGASEEHEPSSKKMKHNASHATKKANAGKFAVAKDNCPMMRKPASAGSPMLVVKKSRKVWVENVNSHWLRGYNSSGKPGYLNKSCF